VPFEVIDELEDVARFVQNVAFSSTDWMEHPGVYKLLDRQACCLVGDTRDLRCTTDVDDGLRRQRDDQTVLRRAAPLDFRALQQLRL
jgi:hypothetical protein